MFVRSDSVAGDTMESSSSSSPIRSGGNNSAAAAMSAAIKSPSLSSLRNLRDSFIRSDSGTSQTSAASASIDSAAAPVTLLTTTLKPNRGMFFFFKLV